SKTPQPGAPTWSPNLEPQTLARKSHTPNCGRRAKRPPFLTRRHGMNEPDRFEDLIYYVEAVNRFHTISRGGRPTSKSWVAVERLPTGQIFLERFRGQAHFGVVIWLDDYFAQPARRAEERGRIEASTNNRILDVGPTAEGPPKKKKPRKEKNPFPRSL